MAKSIHNRKPARKNVLIFELAAIVTMVTLTGFLGFTYVNSQQKLASTDNQSHNTQPAKQSAQKKLSAADIKPINTAADLSAAHGQLDSIQQDLDAADSSQALTADLDSIIN